MKYICLIICGVLALCRSFAVTPGIENFEAYQSMLRGKKVGIVANQTSVTTEGHSVDFLKKRGVGLVKIFCPEHGFRGTADAGETVNDGKDPLTGLPVISLYGNKKKPLPEDLDGIEVMIFDIQDVGVRFYTYLSTLHYVMEACAEHRIPLIVTDRPNPNAFYIDGPVLESRYRSFVGMHPVPIVYGMTIGEYAGMINGEKWLKNEIQCSLSVIPCQKWNRNQPVALPVKPSPNLPDSISVMLYPSVCLFEGTVVSEGRGTHTPFRIFGHPDLSDMPYVFVPQSIPGMSASPKCMGQACHGMDLSGKYEEVKQGKCLRIDWLITAYRHYKGKTPFFTSFFDKLAGTDQLRKDIQAGKSEIDIRHAWQDGLNEFKNIRSRYLLY